MKLVVLALFTLMVSPLFSQKKQLDHSVYDGWQSIGERIISPDGNWVAYTVNPQEGDGMLYVHDLSKRSITKKEFPRGYSAQFSDDSRFLVFRIKPLFKDTREARIKKRKVEEFPKDSIAVLQLGMDSVYKLPRVRGYAMPAKAGGWLAMHKEKESMPASRNTPTQRTVDSLRKTIDSLQLLVMELKSNASRRDESDAENDPASPSVGYEGSDLILRALGKGKNKKFSHVNEYRSNERGTKLLMRVSRFSQDSNSFHGVVLYDLETERSDTLLKGGNDYKNLSITDDGNRVAFLADRNTTKTSQKFYGLYFYEKGSDSAQLVVSRFSEGMNVGMTVSENGAVSFSKSGDRLFFGVAPIPSTKDTSLVEIDLVKLDIWHYKDDYLQTQQLSRLNNELKRSFLSFVDLDSFRIRQLASADLPSVFQTNEGDGNYFFAVTDTNRRIEAQWTGKTKSDIYALQMASGKTTLVKKNHDGSIYPSPTGDHLLLYDAKEKKYSVWNEKGLRKIGGSIQTPLYNEEFDMPTDPNPHGVMGWQEGDSAVFVYDRNDAWKIDLHTLKANLITNGRQAKTDHVYRYLQVDPEERFFRHGQPLYFRVFDKDKKFSSIVMLPNIEKKKTPTYLTEWGGYQYAVFSKAKKGASFLYTKESDQLAPDVFVISKQQVDTLSGWLVGGVESVQLSSINPQQSEYNWLKAELVRWKTFNGKDATGILYKPEDFDSSRKYPMLVYFYERLSDQLYKYHSPAPSASTINIPFFVSRGYLVFLPDIRYTKGHPGKDAYNYIVSGAQFLGKKRWVDEKNIGIQGQSWGGYQVAHLITATNFFKAAWAGAPVVNMFSAYGGIRWGSGLNRQFQYERTQSRIGATPWERPDLYIENSPFYHLNKVKTPVVIMSNDADDAVPWYQGIEFFTGLRRLGKPVWLLNYNNEVHNLAERKNRKDISVRLQQFFDWQLKGEKPAQWLVEGLPAIRKGKDWALQPVD